jgi:hypothetical protein
MAQRKNEPRGAVAGAVGEREADAVDSSGVADAERERCVQFYVDQLHRYVKRAAACVEDADRDDEFLWHVRRGLECLFAAVLESNGKASTDSSGALFSLETLRISAYKIARVEMLSDANYQSLAELLQKNANRGVHAESFQHGSSAARASTPAGPLRNAGFTVARTPFVVLVRWLHGYLDRSTTKIESDLAVIERGNRPQDDQRPLRWGLMVGVGAMILIGGVSFLRGALVLSERRAVTAAQSAPLTTTITVPVLVPERDASAMSITPSAERTVDVASPPSCPAGMLRIEARALRIKKPLGRSGSPWSGFVDGEITAHHACMAHSLVTRRAYDGCVAEGACSSLDPVVARNSMCREAPRESSVRCVSREQAARFCAWRFPASNGLREGRVSSVADWESLRVAAPVQGREIARIPEHVPADQERWQGEWVGDAVPPVLWRRLGAIASEEWQFWRRSDVLDTRAPNVWHSWNARRAEMPAFERIGFRCAVDFAD